MGGIVEFKAEEVNYSSAEVLYKSEGEIPKNVRKNSDWLVKKKLIQVFYWILLINVYLQSLLWGHYCDQYVACEALGISAEAPYCWERAGK